MRKRRIPVIGLALVAVLAGGLASATTASAASPPKAIAYFNTHSDGSKWAWANGTCSYPKRVPLRMHINLEIMIGPAGHELKSVKWISFGTVSANVPVNHNSPAYRTHAKVHIGGGVPDSPAEKWIARVQCQYWNGKKYVTYNDDISNILTITSKSTGKAS